MKFNPIIVVFGFINKETSFSSCAKEKKLQNKSSEKISCLRLCCAVLCCAKKYLKVRKKHGTCLLLVYHKYLALDGVYHPIRNAIPNISTL